MKNSILIIDDDPVFSALVEKIFQKDYSIFISVNGAEALKWLKTNTIPSVIIADLNMPIMNGYELISKLKSDPDYSKIPVIIISGENDTFLKNRCYRAGANKFFSKPINLIQLAITVRELQERATINVD